VALNPKQQRFVAEYLKDLNASAACLRAGYRTKNPDVVGPRLLVQVGIREAVDAALVKRSEKCELTAAKVLEDLQRIARKAEEAEQFSPAAKCLELLGRHLAMFTDKVESTVKVRQPLAIRFVVKDPT
jgi:phage terminase small subunit